MIQREWKTVIVNVYATTVDGYGQARRSTPTTRSIPMVVKIYRQTNVDDPRYNEVELLGLALDKTITTSNTITIDSVMYDVLYVIPSGKYLQVLMRKQ